MQKLTELEKFYGQKIQKHDIEAAINSINSETKGEFENLLGERLTLKDYVFTFLSNVSTYDEFLFLWKSFSAQPDGDLILSLAHQVTRYRFERKGQVGMEIRRHLCDRQRAGRNA